MQVHSVLESLQQGILICDQHSRIVFFNQVYSDFIGVQLETAKGHKITDYRKSAIALPRSDKQLQSIPAFPLSAPFPRPGCRSK